jgi:hypothetical protein
MVICKGKTKLGKKCKCKTKGNSKYCGRHQKGGVKTGIADLNRHIAKFLTLEDVNRMKKVSKTHKKQISKQLTKRAFPHWEVLNNFNTTFIPFEELSKLKPYINDIIRNSEFKAIIFQKPITISSIRNAMLMQDLITDKEVRIINTLNIAELSYLHSKKNMVDLSISKNDQIRFIKTSIIKYLDFVTTDQLGEFKNKYKGDFVNYIKKMSDLLV